MLGSRWSTLEGSPSRTPAVAWVLPSERHLLAHHT